MPNRGSGKEERQRFTVDHNGENGSLARPSIWHRLAQNVGTLPKGCGQDLISKLGASSTWIAGVQRRQPSERVNREANLVLETHLKELGLGFVTEYRICDWRKWRADYALYVLAYMERRVLIEIEGGTWTRNSRHTRGSGYEKDLEKYNTCAAMGYKLFRFSTGQVLTGKAKEFLREWLCLPADTVKSERP